MNATLDRKVLTEALRMARHAAASAASLACLKDVYIEAQRGARVPEDGLLLLAATDLELQVVTRVPARVREAGRTCPDAREFASVVGALAGAEVSLAADGAVTVVEGGRSRFRLSGHDPADFVLLQQSRTGRSIEVPAATLKHRLGLAAFGCDLQEGGWRGGVYLAFFERGWSVVGTDGRRLGISTSGETQGEDAESDPPPVAAAVIPGDKIEAIRAALPDDDEEPVEIGIGASQVSFAWSGTEILSSILDQAYPDYRGRILRKFTPSRRAIADRKELLAVLRRVNLVAGKGKGRIWLSLLESGDLGLYARSGEGDETASYSEAEETVEAVTGGEPLHVCLNGRSLSDALAGLRSDQVSLELASPTDPVRCRDGDDAAYVMAIQSDGVRPCDRT